MKIITHPTPEKFALAISAIAAVDYGFRSDVDPVADGWAVTFETGKAVMVVTGPLMDEYRL